MNVQLSQTLPGDPGAAPVPAAGAAPRQAAAEVVAALQAANAPTKAQKPSAEQIQQAVENLKRITQPVAQNLQFSVDHDTNQTVIRVIDGATQETIRQIPSEEILQLAKTLDRLSGLLLKQKA